MMNKKSVKIVSEESKYQEVLNKITVPENKSVDQAWLELQSKLSSSAESIEGGKVINFRKWWLAAAAAVVVGLAFFAWPANESLVAQATGNGQLKEVTLPDGSTAWMNGSSTLEYSSNWENERAVNMTGEVFFLVKKGSSFIVTTPQGNVEVLGTSFNVISRNSAFRVKCETGKVKVSTPSDQEILLPGDAVENTTEGLIREKHTPNQPDWRVGKLVFEDAQLAEVWETLEWQFNISINDAASSQRVFSGTLSAVDLDQALEQVCLAMNLTFEKTEGKVIIKPKTIR
jgi:transmembrane sensor